MLTIMPRQLEAFERVMADQYERDIADYLRRNAPQYVSGLSKGDLLQCIRGSIERARALGLVKKEAILSLIVLVLISGPTFLTSPLLDRFLAMPGASPDRKMQRLFEIAAAHGSGG